MIKYDLDAVICRENTCSIKNDYRDCAEMLCMWVADMDFAVATPIVDAIHKRANHPIFGYSYIPDQLFTAVSSWYEKRQGYRYDPKRILTYYSVVSAISLVLLSLTDEGDAVTVMAPNYMNFPPAVSGVKRTLLYSTLINQNNHYEIDYADLEVCLSQSKVFLHCSPHNPTGRVWSLEEQLRIAELCEKYHVLVISDEIHSDLIMPGRRHIPFNAVSPKTKDYTVTLLSATKTFNLAHNGVAFIMPGTLKQYELIKQTMDCLHLGAMNIFATTAVQTAYQEGEEWLDQVIPYVHDNYLHVKKFIEEKTPEITVMPMEGTYLMWLDCRKLAVSVVELFEKHGKILGEDGILFGPKGAKYYRLNIATSRIIIDQMLKRLEKAYSKLI
jgi:cysteine-S-conjugate beta-lyase